MTRFTTGAAIVAGALLIMSSAVHAADLPPRYKAPAYTAPAGYDWSGTYVGAQLGYGIGKTDWTFFNGAVSEDFSQSKGRLMGGAQIGYNYQWGRVVLGIEAAYIDNFSNGTASSDATLVANRSRDSKISAIYTVTPRIGYAFDNWLGYAKVGYANGKADFTARVTSPDQVTASSSGRSGGWTVGLGAEYALWQHVIVGLEYDYIKLNVGDRTFVVDPAFAPNETGSNMKAAVHLITTRMSYKFDWPRF